MSFLTVCSRGPRGSLKHFYYLLYFLEVSFLVVKKSKREIDRGCISVQCPLSELEQKCIFLFFAMFNLRFFLPSRKLSSTGNYWLNWFCIHLYFCRIENEDVRMIKRSQTFRLFSILSVINMWKKILVFPSTRLWGGVNGFQNIQPCTFPQNPVVFLQWIMC